MRNKELKPLLIDKITDMKAKEITIIDVTHSSDVTDAMIICTGNSKRHVQSIAEQTALTAKKAGSPAIGIEGLDASEWVLVDLGDVILHVMQNETRQFYQLEKLWNTPLNENSNNCHWH
ncbi:MAG: ribosome silencing factor [Psychromonas sp.]|nr:ribosome silencing factor [Psychromonas sp.]